MDSLALKLLEDSADGPVDIDDDPDIDEWGDMYSDNDGGNDDDVSDSSEIEQALVNDDVSDSDDDEKVQDQDDFMDAEDSDDSDGQEHVDDDDSDDGEALMFADEDDSSDEEPKSRKKARKSDSLPTFADADEYADVMVKHFEAPVGKSKVKSQEVGHFDAKPTKKRNKRRSKS